MCDPLIEAVLATLNADDVDRMGLALHPYLHWTDSAGLTTRGRTNVLAMLAALDRELAAPRSRRASGRPDLPLA